MGLTSPVRQVVTKLYKQGEQVIFDVAKGDRELKVVNVRREVPDTRGKWLDARRLFL